MIISSSSREADIDQYLQGQRPREKQKIGLRLGMGGNGEKLRKLVLVSTKAKYIAPYGATIPPQHILSKRPTHIHQMTHRVYITAVFIEAPNEINTDAYQQKHKQTHCEIVYCKEKWLLLNAKESQRYILGKRNQTPKSTYYVVLFL